MSRRDPKTAKAFIWATAVAVPIIVALIAAFPWKEFFTPPDDDPGPETKIYDNIRATSALYEFLREWRLAVGARKVVLIQAHDSGGAIPTKSTVKAEALTDEAVPVLNQWHEQKLDGPYIAMLEKLLLNGRVTNYPPDMPYGTLRTIYEARGVALSDVRLVGASEEELCYVSVVFDELPETWDTTLEEADRRFSSKHEAEMLIHLGQLRKMLRKLGEIR